MATTQSLDAEGRCSRSYGRLGEIKEMETIQIRFSELRSVSTSVIAFLENEYWWEDGSFKTEIENDLGITGNDGSELMEKFSKRFQVDIASFQSEQYFDPEPSGINPLVLIFTLLALTTIMLKVLLVGLVFPFSRVKSQQVWDYSLTSWWNRWSDEWDEENLEEIKSILRLEDLIVTVVKGRFTPRQEVKFILEKNGMTSTNTTQN